MKKYFIHNGTEQQGPFDLDDLKSKMISKETPIWYEGLEEWTTAEKLEELKDVFKPLTPPPFNSHAKSQPVYPPRPPVKQPVKQKTTRGKIMLLIFGIIGLIIVVLILVNNTNSKNQEFNKTNGASYQEKVQSVEETERSQPSNFLSVGAKYDKNFWGTKINVHGVIKNSATIATFKDVVVNIVYYTKTQTELGNKNYTIYDVFPPQSEKKFELKIDNYKDVSSIGLTVQSAMPN